MTDTSDGALKALMDEARSYAHDYDRSTWLDDAIDSGNHLSLFVVQLVDALSALLTEREAARAREVKVRTAMETEISLTKERTKELTGMGYAKVWGEVDGLKRARRILDAQEADHE
jgi:hypothetical protein